MLTSGVLLNIIIDQHYLEVVYCVLGFQLICQNKMLHLSEIKSSLIIISLKEFEVGEGILMVSLTYFLGLY